MVKIVAVRFFRPGQEESSDLQTGLVLLVGDGFYEGKILWSKGEDTKHSPSSNQLPLRLAGYDERDGLGEFEDRAAVQRQELLARQ